MIEGVYLQNSIETMGAVQSYVDQLNNTVSHTVLILLAQYKSMAVRVIFDATEDVFDSVLDTAIEIINSIVLD